MCRQGSSAIQSAVLETIPEASLRAYVAWVPILEGDGEGAAQESKALVADGRASHYWDEGRGLPDVFAKLLALPEGWLAWDVYLAYPSGVRWEEEPPAPSFWHHQLPELTLAPRLDGEVFAEGVRGLLEGR